MPYINKSKPQFQREAQINGSFGMRWNKWLNTLRSNESSKTFGELVSFEMSNGNMKGSKLFIYIYNIEHLVSYWGVLFITRRDVQSRTLPRKNALEGDETSHLRAPTGPQKDSTVQQRTAHNQQGCVPAVSGWRCLWGRGAARARPFLRGSSALSGRAWAGRCCSSWNRSSDLGWET